MNVMKLSCHTNYPGLYKDTYWGNFSEECIDENIIYNRNEFAKKFKLKKYVENMPVYLQQEFLNNKCTFDHGECYLAGNRCYVLVSSPYTVSDYENYIKSGWMLHDELYNNQAITYVKVIKMKNKKRKLF